MAFEGATLPRGWRWAKLGEVLRQRNEIIHPRDKPIGTSTFVGLEHIESQTGRRLGAVELDLARMTGRRAVFRQGDIVYGYLRPYLNKVWIAEFAGLCSVDQYVFIANSEIALTEYVALYMRSELYLSLAPIGATPGQLPRIRTDEVANTPIPLPPLHDQCRIVVALDERRGRIGILKELALTQGKAFDSLRARLVASRIPIEGENLPAERGWQWMALGEAAEIVMGQSPPGSRVTKKPNGLPLLNGPTEFDRDSDGHPKPVQWTTDITKTAAPGDLLLCVRGATTGRRNWADQTYCIGRGLAALRPHAKGLSRSLLGFTIDRIVNAILARAPGSIFPSISGTELAGISVAVPSKERADAISQELASVVASSSIAQRLLKLQDEEYRSLEKAFMRSAFAGEF